MSGTQQDTKQQTLSPTYFKRHLPKDTQLLTVKLNGNKSATSNPASPISKVRDRTYSVTVEPNGRTRKAKDNMRRECKRLTSLDFDLERSSDPSLEGLLDKRFCFRQDRVKHLEVGRQFPALTNQQLVPSWRLTTAGKESFRCSKARSHSQEDKQSRLTKLTKPTTAHIRKSMTKRPQDPAKPWLVSGAAEAEGLICDRNPALFQDEYDSPRQTQRHCDIEARDRWVGENTILPTSTAEAKMLCDSARPEVDRHIAIMRARGRYFNEELKERYELKRDLFQRQWEERGPISNFEASVIAKEKTEEFTRREHQKKLTELPKPQLLDSVLDAVGGHFTQFRNKNAPKALVG